MPPIFIAFDEPAVYGLPAPHERTYKVARHHAGATVDPETTDMAVDACEVDVLRAAARRWLPHFDDRPVAVDTCLYDNTANEDFVLERHGNVVVGAGTTGHGFKFGPVFGESLAALVLEQ
jgi:sarcosine oxidase